MSDLKRLALQKYEETVHVVAQGWFDQVTETLFQDWEEHAQRCESPIESLLLAHMCFASYGYSNWRIPARLTSKFDGTDAESREGMIVIVPQAQIAGCRVDFAVYAGNLVGQWASVAIECDGHEFHEKTKEQAARDKSRDRALASYGVTTLRFTGSEIYRDPENCVAEIACVLCMQIERSLHLTGKVEAEMRIAAFLPAFRKA